MTINTQKLRDLIRHACPLPWTLATSNSWRRIVDPYHVPVCSPCNQPDGHPDLAFPGGAEGPTARLLIEGINALPGLLDQIDALAAENEKLRDVLAKARELIVADRESLVETHGIGGIIQPDDHEGLLGLYEYDCALEVIDAALQGGSR